MKSHPASDRWGAACVRLALAALPLTFVITVGAGEHADGLRFTPAEFLFGPGRRAFIYFREIHSNPVWVDRWTYRFISIVNMRFFRRAPLSGDCGEGFAVGRDAGRELVGDAPGAGAGLDHAKGGGAAGWLWPWGRRCCWRGARWFQAGPMGFSFAAFVLTIKCMDISVH